MKTINKLFMICLAALTLTVGACGGDDDPKPVTPSYLQTGTATRPTTWTAPDYSLYEVTMSVQVQLGDTLRAYQSAGDLMCATIDGEVRAVAPRQTTDGIHYYALTIAGSGDDHAVALHYYCDRLNRIYTLPSWCAFNPAAAPTGDSGLYRPMFTTAE